MALVVALGLAAGFLLQHRLASSTPTEALRDAGFADVGVDFSSSDSFDELDVTTDPASLEGDGDSLAELAAGVVWTNFPLRFDDLEVTMTG